MPPNGAKEAYEKSISLFLKWEGGAHHFPHIKKVILLLGDAFFDDDVAVDTGFAADDDGE